MTPHVTGLPPSVDEPLMEELSTLSETSSNEADNSRPSTHRRSTDPSPSISPSPYPKLSSLALRPRNRSPYSRSHLRARSSLSSLSAPPTTRAHSSPIVDTFVYVPPTIDQPTSPLLVPVRHQSPLRRPLDEPYSSFGGQVDIGETISENSELHLTPKQSLDVEAIPGSPLSIHHTFPRSRRRPSSPLHHILQSGISPLHSSASSPSLASAAKYNESFPSTYSFSSSSMPSTPTSFRSRSPSISSLETIPDSPDAEREAQEADNIARLKAAADRESEREAGRRRGSLDVPGRVSGGMVLGMNGFGVVYGLRDKRKRWSVCGAERRGDLDLETIWED